MVFGLHVAHRWPLEWVATKFRLEVSTSWHKATKGIHLHLQCQISNGLLALTHDMVCAHDSLDTANPYG